MASLGLTVTVTPVVTVDDKTADTLLGLLDLYCRANRKIIRTRKSGPTDSEEDFKITLEIENDIRQWPVGRGEE